MILCDIEIEELCDEHNMIDPFTRESFGQISYGLSSYGYDVRVANEFKIFTNIRNPIVDPKDFDDDNFINVQSYEPVIIPPNSFALARSVEWIKMPRHLLAICLGKSTYARCGIVVNVTPLEPEWEGHITIEISNTTPNPALIYPNEGIAQLVFHRGITCRQSYADKRGKYQGQTGITLPR